MIFVRALALLTALLAATSLAAQAVWLTVEGPDRAFTVQLPGAPEYKTASGVHSYSLTRGPMEYVVQTVLYPPEIDVSRPQAVLQAALDGTAPHLANGKWDKVAWSTVQGGTAAEATGTFKNGSAFRNLVVLKCRQLFSLGVRGPPGTTKFPDADRFLASLRLP